MTEQEEVIELREALIAKVRIPTELLKTFEVKAHTFGVLIEPSVPYRHTEEGYTECVIQGVDDKVVLTLKGLSTRTKRAGIIQRYKIVRPIE